MPAKKIASTESEFVLTCGKRQQVAKLLHEAGLQRALDQALSRMESLASRFGQQMDQLGFRPTQEDLDRSLGSSTYESRRIEKMDEMSEVDLRKWWIGVEKVDRLLLRYCEDFAHCWKWATGHSLPRLDREVFKQAGVGYHPALNALTSGNPLWLFLQAVGLKLSAETVEKLIIYARSKPSAKAERNNREARTRKRSEPSRRSESPL